MILQVWSGPLSGGAIAVLLFNRSPAVSPITANWTDLGLNPSTPFAVRDLWAHVDMGSFTATYTASVSSHGVVMLTFTPISVA